MLRLVTTSDGSPTLLNEELEEHYHSRHGAIRESQHVFIDAGLKAVTVQGCVNILEIGLGTGLNAFLTFLEKKEVMYTALEAFPLDESITNALNYPALLNADAANDVFRNIHSSDWGRVITLSSTFELKKIKGKVQDTELDQAFHLIYFDAFAPGVQPELWTKEIFDKMFAALLPGGILVTYCAKGEVKRNMKAAGFTIEALQGPPGKREMTRAKRDF